MLEAHNYKLADIATPLQAHQQRVVDRLSQADQPGLVVAHGLGSGKTLSSIAALDALGMPTTAVMPAALQANYAKEIAKHTEGHLPALEQRSLQQVSRQGADALPGKGLLIVDEAHRARDPSSKAHAAIAGAQAAKRMLLTASPTYNHPADLASLVNLAAGHRVLPDDRAGFAREFVATEKVNPNFFARVFRGIKPGERQSLTNTDELHKHLDKWVDYHANSADSADFPTSTDTTYKVPMSSHQQDVYDALIGKAPAWMQYKIKAGLPPTKAESEQLNAFMTAARQAQLNPAVFNANSPGGVDATKQQAAYLRFHDALAKNPNHRAVVYSNYLDAGLSPYRAMLDRDKVPYAAFTGDMKKQDRDQAVQDYNAGKLKALLVSSAGGEGLDLKGTRQMQILEPHWNDEKLKQVVGRGIRYKSHEALPEDQRNVAVERYLSTVHPGFFDRMLGRTPKDQSADQYLSMLSHDKARLNDQLTELLAHPKYPQSGVRSS